MGKEALFGAFEDRERSRFGAAVERTAAIGINDPGCLKRVGQVGMDNCPGLCIGIVNRDLILAQTMLEDFIFDPGERQGPGGIEPKRLQIARDQFHCGDAAAANIGHKRLAVGKSCLRSPKPKPGRIGEVVDVRSPGRRSIEHAGARQQVLEADPGDALLRSLDLAACAFAACRISHCVGFVEHDHPIEVVASPSKDLPEPGCIAAPRTQGRIGHKQDAFAHGDLMAELPLPERLNVDRKTAECRPVAPRVLKQGLVLRNPDMAALAPDPAIEDHTRSLAAFASTRAVAEEIAHPVSRAMFIRNKYATLVFGRAATGKIAGMGANGIDQGLGLRGREHALGNEACRQLRHFAGDRRSDRSHRDRFHERGRMLRGSRNQNTARTVGQIVAQLLGNRCRRFERGVAASYWFHRYRKALGRNRQAWTRASNEPERWKLCWCGVEEADQRTGAQRQRIDQCSEFGKVIAARQHGLGAGCSLVQHDQPRCDRGAAPDKAALDCHIEPQRNRP